MFFDPMKERNVDCHIILGNHDVFYKNTNDINSPELLLQDYSFKIYKECEIVDFSGRKMLFVPWINVENEKATMEKIAKNETQYILGHLAINGCEHIKGHVESEGLEQKVFEKYTKILSGHFHHRSVNNDIMYLGCPYEMQWSDYGNQKGFHILDTDDMSIKFVANPFKLFKRIEYDDVNYDPRIIENLERCYVKVIVKNKSDPAKFERFIEDLNNRKVSNIMIVEDSMLESDVPELNSNIEDTMTFITKYVESMSNENVDKEKLTRLLNELYIKANELEE